MLLSFAISTGYSLSHINFELFVCCSSVAGLPTGCIRALNSVHPVSCDTLQCEALRLRLIDRSTTKSIVALHCVSNKSHLFHQSPCSYFLSETRLIIRSTARCSGLHGTSTRLLPLNRFASKSTLPVTTETPQTWIMLTFSSPVTEVLG